MKWLTDALAALTKHGFSINLSRSFQETGYKNMRDRNELIDAILTAYDNPNYQPIIKDGKLIETFCNVAANEIAQKYGCNDLWDAENKRVRTADEIYDFMVNHSDSKDPNNYSWQEFQVSTLQAEFQEVNLSCIQFWANTGYLVFAVQNSHTLNQEHGHICVIRPGIMKTSGKWGKVPSCMNIGGENFIAIAQKGIMKGIPVGVNEAFQQMPRFFAWKGA